MQRPHEGPWRLAARLLAALAVASLPATLRAADRAAEPERAPFAVVAGTTITAAEYDAAYAVTQRQRYYHRQVPEGKDAELRRDVGDMLINRVLLVAEAARRGIGPDRGRIQAQIGQYEQRYRASPQWPKMREEALPALTRELERQSTLERLESAVRGVAPPPEAILREYYERHVDRFTEPEQYRVSLILLKVDPSSPKLAWQKAQEEAAAIRTRIARGADFGSLARLHSTDPSAEKSGDMGYLHRGMLPAALDEQVDKLRNGTVSEPIRLLEGYALVRIDDRKAAHVRRFEDVRERALQLWQRDEGDRRWTALLAELRGRARIEVVDASRYPGQPARP